MKASHGFMARKDYLRDNWPYKVKIKHPHALATRPEEYFMAKEAVSISGGRMVLDAACGWHPEMHILPQLIVDTTHPGTGAELADYYSVVAMDLNPEVLYRFKPHRMIIRMLGDICAMPFADRQFDTVLCISVLEHLPPSYQTRAWRELVRVSRDVLVVTADAAEPDVLRQAAIDMGYDPGDRIDPAEEDILYTEKNDKVVYLIARRIND